jgi:hypothetical protein
LTPQELLELNQTAYDTVVRKLSVMEPYSGHVMQDQYELYFKGEVSSVKVVVSGPDADTSTHRFCVYDTKNGGYSWNAIFDYIYMSDKYKLSQKFANMVINKAREYQDDKDRRQAEEAEKRAINERIELANLIKQFVTSF